MAICYLGIGSNLGNREKNIAECLDRLETFDIAIIQKSSIIETKPEGGPKQNDYLNCVIKVRTHLNPFQLLDSIKSIEDDLGRIKTVHNGPRPIDIDILTYDQLRMRSDQLTIPHPRMLERKFVMEPLSEIAPNLTSHLSCSS